MFGAVAASLLALSGCRSSPNAGPLGEGMTGATRIVAVDTARPPASVDIELERASYVAVLLVAPGHSATLLYPRDTVPVSRLDAGKSTVSFRIPDLFVRSDSQMISQRRAQRIRQDSLERVRARTGRTRPTTLPPPSPETPTYLLVVASPQELSYARIIEKTAGVSIPLVEAEALNAVGKAIRSTLASEPRELAAFFQLVTISRAR
jgi:hypothetical protein